MPGPLEHLVVIEAAPVMPGSIAGMLLADHGAEVIKVEPRGGAFFAHDLSRKGWDRGKKSIELDIADAKDREALRGLLKGADIFIHTFPSLKEPNSSWNPSDSVTGTPACMVVPFNKPM